MVLVAEIEIDETKILEQMEAVKTASDRYENEMLKLRGMLGRGKTKSIEEQQGKTVAEV